METNRYTPPTYEGQRAAERRKNAVPSYGGIRLREIREDRIGGYRKLSKLTGIPVTTLANYEQGVTQTLKAEHVVALARAFGMTYREILDELGIDVVTQAVRLGGAA